jgi:hypothetical protein
VVVAEAEVRLEVVEHREVDEGEEQRVEPRP